MKAREGGLRVLVVDDDVEFARSMQRWLALGNVAADVEHDGAAAVRALSQQTYASVLLDIGMQPCDGWFVLEHLRKMPDVPRVVVVSGAADVSLTVRAMRAGAMDVLTKPVNLDVVRALVAEPAAGDAAGSADVAAPAAAPHRDRADRLLGSSAEMAAVREQIRSVAAYPGMSVHIVGETGTGKELAAQAIHELSDADGPMVTINCAAIPEHLFESELFGHEAGAFTGSRAQRRGLLEVAGPRGTVFLDEVGELAAPLQAKLLRALETRRFRRVGANTDLSFDARVVSATHRGVLGVRDGTLRPDLYYRLAAFTIRMPSLRSRSEDIPFLARHFLEEFARRYGTPERTIDPAGLQILLSHRWPGNVRELRSVIERASVVSRDGTLDAAVIANTLRSGAAEPYAAEPPPVSAGGAPSSGLREVERELILGAFEETGGNITRAARRLGIPRTTLRDKIRRYASQ